MPGMTVRLGKLFSPATLISIIALIVAVSVPAWAATIGAGDIKDNAVRSYHVKNGQIKPADLSAQARQGLGARAVAFVDGSASSCSVVAGDSRAFKATCSRTGPGQYVIEPKGAVNLTGTYPVCAFPGNGGYNTLYDYHCDVQTGYPDGRSMRVTVSRTVETTTVTPRELADVDVVVVIP